MTGKYMQRKLFYGIAILAIVFGLIFFSRTAPVALLRSEIVSMFRPIFHISSMLGRIAGIGRAGPDDLSGLQDENRRLREVEQQSLMLIEKNADLQKMLGLKEKQRIPLQGSRVLLYGNEFGKEFLMLDEGSVEKIRQGNLVVDVRGNLVGVIREAGEGFAKVSLASNPGEAFEVIVAPLGVKALAKGIGNRAFSLELIPDTMPVRSGDFALMPGRLGTTNILAAEITAVASSGVGAFQNVSAVLIARPETLDEVFIILE